MAAKRQTRSKAASKSARKNVRAPSVAVGIPEGFTMPASANTPFHDFNSTPILQGERIAVRTVNRKKPKKGESKTMDIMTVRAVSGQIVAVSRSYALNGLFDETLNGAMLFIRKDGQKKLPGGHKVNEFTCAFKNPEGSTPKVKKAKK